MSESRNQRRDEQRHSAAMSRRQIEREKRSSQIAPPDFEHVAFAEDEGTEQARYVLARDARERLDRYLQNRLKHVSRSQIQKLIDLGGVSVNGRNSADSGGPKASTRLKAGDVVDVVLPPRPCHSIEPEPIPLDILYEDDDMLVLNKQADLMVHPARSILTGTLLNALAYYFLSRYGRQTRLGVSRTPDLATDRVVADPSKPAAEPTPVDPSRAGGRNTDADPDPDVDEATSTDSGPKPGLASGVDSRVSSEDGSGGDWGGGFEDDPGGGWMEHLSSVGIEGNLSRGEGPRPGIVHRLDKHTTGVMVIAKRDETHWMLAQQFERKTNLKCYLAVVHGVPDPPSGAIDAPLGKHLTIKEAQAVRRDPAGRESLTLYRTREHYSGYALVELELRTGRTHQIRVHLAFLGYPIVGDVLYGGLPVGPPELAEPPGYPSVPNQPFVVYARTKEQGQKIEAQAEEVAASDPRSYPWMMTRPALHATLLRLRHPVLGRDMTFTAPLHEPMRSLVHALRGSAGPHGRLDAPGSHVDLGEAIPEPDPGPPAGA